MQSSRLLLSGWTSEGERRFLLPGPAGDMEILVNGVQAVRGLCLICHPHPLFGGSMDNKVVFTLARAMRDSGYVAVRFNFRGVGGSAGVHAGGVGELDDAQWLLQQIVGAASGLPVVLAGFSFGAAIVAAMACRQQASAVVLVAPPVPHYGLHAIRSIPAPVLLLQADDDDVVDSKALQEWWQTLSAPGKVVRRWDRGGHFFHGHLPELKTAVNDFMSLLGY